MATIPDVKNGYISEGGITVYARKMQARFKEGLEAVRQRNHDFNDRFVPLSLLCKFRSVFYFFCFAFIFPHLHLSSLLPTQISQLFYTSNYFNV